MKKQKTKNLLLLILMVSAVAVFFLTIVAQVQLLSPIVKTTLNSSTPIEQLSILVSTRQLLTLFLFLFSMFTIWTLKEPFKRFLERNNFAEKAAKYFGE